MEGLWKLLKDNLPSATDNGCGWTKGPPRHKIIYCGKNRSKVVLKSLTYKLGEIQREQSMQQGNLQKKKDLVTSLQLFM